MVVGDGSSATNASTNITAMHHNSDENRMQSLPRSKPQDFNRAYGEDISEGLVSDWIASPIRELLPWSQIYGPTRNPDGTIRIQVIIIGTVKTAYCEPSPVGWKSGMVDLDMEKKSGFVTQYILYIITLNFAGYRWS